MSFAKSHQLTNMQELKLDSTALALFVDDICGGDEDIIADLLETYCESTKGLLINMQQALEAGENDELRRAAHSLKSSCRIFGAEWLAHNCEQVEQLALVGKTKDVPLLIDIIHAQTSHLRTLLRSQFRFRDCMDDEDSLS